MGRYPKLRSDDRGFLFLRVWGQKAFMPRGGKVGGSGQKRRRDQGGSGIFAGR